MPEFQALVCIPRQGLVAGTFQGFAPRLMHTLFVYSFVHIVVWLSIFEAGFTKSVKGMAPVPTGEKQVCTTQERTRTRHAADPNALPWAGLLRVFWAFGAVFSIREALHNEFA